MKLINKLLIFSTLLAFNANANEMGKELTKQNCASCHLLTIPTPEIIPTLKAPAMDAVAFHLKDAMSGDLKKAKAFILDYVINPNVKKSVCESNKVAKFGVMPSLKGKISKEDLGKIADYILEIYPRKEFVDMIKELLTNGKIKALKTSPFLINQTALPHLTKILIENWDKGALGLTPEQKEKLLVVRKETIRSVKALKKKLAPLESEIIEDLVDEKDLKIIQPKVDKVAKLKAQATMVHLKCLKSSVEILTEEQLEYLLPFWGI